MKKLLITSAAALFALSTAVSAATLSIVSATSDPLAVASIPGGTAKNDVLDHFFGVGSSARGYFGSKIVAAGFGANDKLLVEIMGYEAGFRNTFTAGTGSFTSPGGAAYGTTLTTPLARWTVSGISDGDLGFTFSTNGLGGKSISNGATNANVNGEINFFASTLIESNGSLWLFLDDGGANKDDNHDDLVIRLSAVPLPAGALLLLTGLGALALRRRKTA